jgi:hypothetical protein
LPPTLAAFLPKALPKISLPISRPTVPAALRPAARAAFGTLGLAGFLPEPEEEPEEGFLGLPEPGFAAGFDVVFCAAASDSA